MTTSSAKPTICSHCGGNTGEQCLYLNDKSYCPDCIDWAYENIEKNVSPPMTFPLKARSPMSAELKAMEDIIDAVRPLNKEGQSRVMRYIWDYYKTEVEK